MSAFTTAEIAYLKSQPLGRDFASRKKFRDVQRNPRVAFVVDDVPSVKPWVARGIEIRGRADVLETGGEAIMRGFAPQMFRIAAKRIVSWGLEGPGFSANARSVG